MHITPEMMEAAYELLRTTPPFRSWRLPPGADVEFHVIRSNDRSGDYFRKAGGTHCIRVNDKWVGNLLSLLRVMAHEMCHLRHEATCPGDQAVHGRRFSALASAVCRSHHLDPKSF